MATEGSPKSSVRFQGQSDAPFYLSTTPSAAAGSPSAAVGSDATKIEALEDQVNDLRASIPNEAISALTGQMQTLEGRADDIQTTSLTGIVTSLSERITTLAEQLGRMTELLSSSNRINGEQIDELKGSIPSTDNLKSLFKEETEDLRRAQETFSGLAEKMSDLESQVGELTPSGADKSSTSFDILQRQIDALKTSNKSWHRINAFGFALIFALGAYIVAQRQAL